MSSNTLVFGDDGSPSADVAWLWINSHAWPSWRLEVVRAVVPEFVKVSAVTPMPREWQPDNPRTAFAESCFDEVVQLTIDQDPRIALTRHTDLLVIGPRGPGVAKAMHIGSTAEWLLVHPPSPMVIARNGRATRTVMVCHDGSPSAQAATATLGALPWSGDLSVEIVAVDDGRVDVEPATEDARQQLSSIGACVSVTILSGEPTKELVKYAAHQSPDLVVMGTRGLTGLSRLRVGSTASAVAHATNHSVLLACDPGQMRVGT
jgi:nucleotide-binding universal stress UspA family protein